MPVVTVDWWAGNGLAERRRLVEEITSSVSDIAKCPADAVTVVIRDTERDRWGKGGTLASEL